MPLSSPAKGSRAESNARMQAQIVDLTQQRDNLIVQYLAALGTERTDSGVMAREQPQNNHDQSAEMAPHGIFGPATMEMAKTDSTGGDARIPLTGPISSTLSQTDVDVALAHANSSLKRHIKLLHDYNEIKDIGTGIIGIIADQRGVRVVDVMEEMGVNDED